VEKPLSSGVVRAFVESWSRPRTPAATSASILKALPWLARRFDTVSHTPANLAVDLTLGSNLTFPTGGRITVSAGVTNNSRGVLEGTTKFSISKGATSVEPGGQSAGHEGLAEWAQELQWVGESRAGLTSKRRRGAMGVSLAEALGQADRILMEELCHGYRRETAGL
jgi:hypothetical protein